jgi:hypothetical protein
MIPRCPHCGAIVQATDENCPICQYPVPLEVRQGTGAPPVSPSPALHGTGRGGRTLVRVVALVGWAILVGGGAWVLWSWANPTGPGHPDEWDPRVVDFVEFVEGHRGLRFDHPVHVDFVPADEFSEDVTSDEAAITDEEREQYDQVAAFYRAFGLVDADLDLLEANNQLSSEGILAYYDPETLRIRVRGTEVTPGLAVTLVHELTHALQDQHFDLGRLEEIDDIAEATAFRAVIEGDASLVEQAYVAGLGEDELAAYLDEIQGEVDDVLAVGAPDFLATLLSAPYSVGPAFLEALAAHSGADAIDEALRSPPVNDEQLLDPRAYLDADVPESVTAPVPRTGPAVLDSGTLGPLFWYLVLAEQLEPAEALAALDGWAGDVYVTREVDGQVCVDARVAMDDADLADSFATAFVAWGDLFEGGEVDVDRSGSEVDLSSCDPGDAAAAPVGRSSTTLGLPVVRLYLFSQAVVLAGEDEELGWCIADHMTDQLTVADLENPALFEDDRLTDLLAEATDACG